MRKSLIVMTTALALAFSARADQPAQPAPAAAGERTLQSEVGPSHWSYKYLKGLAQRGGLTRPFPADDRPLTRAEMALYTANAADTVMGKDAAPLMLADVPALPPLPGEAPVLPPPPAEQSFTPQASDRDMVYKLVQQYQEDLVKMGAKITAVEDQLVALKTRNDEIMEKIEKLVKMTGLRINGEAVVRTVNLQRIYGGTVERVWPTIGYMDMNINARPRPNMYAELVYRMETVFGAYWGSQNVSGIRRFKMRADTPVGVTLGMLDYKNTPLTVWANEEEFPFEGPISRRQREEGMKDLYLGDNRWPIYGALVDTTVMYFDAVDQYFQVMGSKLATTSQKNTGLPYGVSYSYDQYLVGGRTAFTFPASPSPLESLNKLGKAFNVTLGANYFEIRDISDSQTDATRVDGVQYNNVVSGDIKVGLLNDSLQIKGEWARASYNPDMDYCASYNWNAGNAGNIHFILDNAGTKVDLYGLMVEKDFINYAAQSLTRDYAGDAAQYDGVYAPQTADNLFNPSNGNYGLGPVAYRWMSRYNSVISATNQGAARNLSTGAQAGGVYMSYDPFTNNSLPYGEATSNRQGGGLKYNGSYANGLLQPAVAGSYFSEMSPAWYLGDNPGDSTYTDANGVFHDKVDTTKFSRTFLRGQGGMKVDLNGLKNDWLRLAVWGGFTYEKTMDGVDTEDRRHYVDLISSAADFGLDYEVVKRFHLLGGWRHEQWDGSEFINNGTGIGAARYTWLWSAYLIDSDSYGMSWDISKAASFYFGYTRHRILQAQSSASYLERTGETHEFDARFGMKF